MTVGAVSQRLSLRSVILHSYAFIFAIYLLLPLVVAAVGAFNDVDIPTASRWNGFTLRWFSALLSDGQLGYAAVNSIWIILGNNFLAIPLGLSGAILIARWKSRLSSGIYTLMTVPLLTPGILFGIATLLFWQQFGVSGGVFLATVAQTPELAAICMMLFLGRLHRFDDSLEEAARDLGASPLLVIWHITIPFLMPTILSASALVSLLSFGNYNTTVFVIGAQATVTTWFGSKVRLGLTPEVNAVAVVIGILTIAASLFFHLRRRKNHLHAG